MKSNFDFLEKEFPVLAQFGKKAEAYLYSDSNSCLMKLGMIGETIVNLMFTYDHIAVPTENTAANRITVLYQEGLLTRDLVEILHALRSSEQSCSRKLCFYLRRQSPAANGVQLVRMVYADLWGLELPKYSLYHAH